MTQDKNKYNTPKYRLIVRFTNTDIICQVRRQYSLIPRPPLFFVLRFTFSIKHGSDTECKLKNNKKKNGGGLGTRLATILCLEFIPTGYKGMLMLGDKTEAY